jgi:hypothetical protein
VRIAPPSNNRRELEMLARQTGRELANRRFDGFDRQLEALSALSSRMMELETRQLVRAHVGTNQRTANRLFRTAVGARVEQMEAELERAQRAGTGHAGEDVERSLAALHPPARHALTGQVRAGFDENAPSSTSRAWATVGALKGRTDGVIAG